MVGKAPDELLWCRPDGQPLRPPTTTHWFGAAVKRCQAADEKFPRVTVHDQRHTAASTPPAVSVCLSNIAQRELLTWSTVRAKVNLRR
jgi:hypothetical protein